METKAVIISGEAPESDEESISIKTGNVFPSLLTTSSCGTMIQGEAKESDEENNSISSASYIVDPATCAYVDSKGIKNKRSSVKYNSLLHKKLRECNKSLDKDFQNLLTSSITTAKEDLNEINRQLLKSELILQDTVHKLQTSSTQFEVTLSNLFTIIDEDFFQNVKL